MSDFAVRVVELVGIGATLSPDYMFEKCNARTAKRCIRARIALRMKHPRRKKREREKGKGEKGEGS
jgi:hypothetical protein